MQSGGCKITLVEFSLKKVAHDLLWPIAQIRDSYMYSKLLKNYKTCGRVFKGSPIRSHQNNEEHRELEIFASSFSSDIFLFQKYSWCIRVIWILVLFTEFLQILSLAISGSRGHNKLQQTFPRRTWKAGVIRWFRSLYFESGNKQHTHRSRQAANRDTKKAVGTFLRPSDPGIPTGKSGRHHSTCMYRYMCNATIFNFIMTFLYFI